VKNQSITKKSTAKVINEGVYVLLNRKTGQLWDVGYEREYLENVIRKECQLDDDWVAIKMVPEEKLQ
jgi:hypothetical protein